MMSDLLALGVVFDGEFLETALITIFIEVFILYCIGCKNKKVLAWFALTNFVSNVLFNEILMSDTIFISMGINCAVFLGECLVVLMEYCMMLYILPKGGQGLFLVLLVTNCCSWLAGYCRGD